MVILTKNKSDMQTTHYMPGQKFYIFNLELAYKMLKFKTAKKPPRIRFWGGFRRLYKEAAAEAYLIQQSIPKFPTAVLPSPFD
jgi:hypothetical protein